MGTCDENSVIICWFMSKTAYLYKIFLVTGPPLETLAPTGPKVKVLELPLQLFLFNL